MDSPAFATPGFPMRSTFRPQSQFTKCNQPHLRVVESRRANLTMVSKTNIAKKAAKVAYAKDLLANSQMIFATPLEGLTVAQVMELKRSLPAGSKVATVKNTLMRRAIADSEWVSAGDLTKNSSMWFFIEEDIKGTMDVYDKFCNTLKREEMAGGVYEGQIYDAKGIQAIAALPSYKELIAKVAISLKMVPTKLARSVNAVPTKMARAIRLAVADEDGGTAGQSE